MKRICTIDIESNGLLDQLIDFSEFPYKLNSKARLWTVVITDFNTRKSVFAERGDLIELATKTDEEINYMLANLIEYFINEIEDLIKTL